MSGVLLNTRPAGQVNTLNSLLKPLNYQVIHIPMVEPAPVKFQDELAKTSGEYTGLFFSSINGLIFFASSIGLAKTKWGKLPLFTLSKAVSGKLAQEGFPVTFCPQETSLKGFLKEYSGGINGKWLHPCSSETRLNPADFLSKGIEVHNLPVYRPELPKESCGQLQKQFPHITAVLFTSGTGVKNFSTCLRALGEPNLSRAFARRRVFSLGPSVSEALEMGGYKNYISIPNADLAELPDLLERFSLK